MAISTQIPLSQNVPLYWVTVDGSMAGNLTEQEPALLVGHMFTTAKGASLAGTAAMDIPIPISSVAFAGQMFGVGSMLERMVRSFFANNVTQLIFAIPCPEPGAGIAATGSVAFTHIATASGLYTLYIGGQIVQIVVQPTDTLGNIGNNLSAAINAIDDMPVTASLGTSGTVTLTCKWKGLSGNDITLLENYKGPLAGEGMPGGMTTTVVQMTGGSGNPSFVNTITNTADGDYVNVAMPFTDSASLSIWATEYGFGPTGRWNYIRQQYGWVYSAHRSATYSAAITYGMTRNDPTISQMEIEANTPSPVWEVAAAYCGRGSAAFLDDPARPLQTLELMGIVTAIRSDRYTNVLLNNITNNGLAIQRVNDAGNMMILREQTTYQKNSYGQGDTAFGLLTVLSTLSELIRRQRAAITSKFPRHKLAPDGTRFGPGQAIVTPTSIKAELIAEARIDEFDGLIADVDWMKNNMIVEIDDHNPNRVNVLYPPRLIGQLRIFAALAQFRLLLPQDSGITP
jgi:phage tail sheath gpL-like